MQAEETVLIPIYTSSLNNIYSCARLHYLARLLTEIDDLKMLIFKN